MEASDDNELQDSSDVIVVKNWDELKKYASKGDKNYVLKLKENTNFYPTSPTDKNYQIKVNNNLTIIGSEGAYIGETCQHAAYINNGRYVVEGSNPITYTPIIVPDDSHLGITLENITFKWIYTSYSPDGLFLQMGGNAYNLIKNCKFENIVTFGGHSNIVYIKRGDATLENCSFINCTTDFGCADIFDPAVPETSLHSTARMLLKNCYFENNFARTEPGAINNCGLAIVYNTTFINNRAGVWAGAIHTHGGANTTLYNCEFIDNVAGWNGGALYTYSYLQIYNSTFRGNNCTTNNGGGAIGACAHLTTPHIFITNSLFENNANNCWSLDELSTTGTGRGGAISLMDEGSLEVRNTTFIANSASIGTAICAIGDGIYGSPNIIIVGNTFINHTRVGDVLNVRTAGTPIILGNNTFISNSIEFSNITFTIFDPIDKKVNVSITSTLKNPSYYDSDILDKCKYDIYVDGIYKETINGIVFTLNFEDIETCKVYVVPSIYNGRSDEITVTVPRDYIYVSKEKGSDSNNGLSTETPVYSLSKAIELAKSAENIMLMDGEFNEENLNINYRLTIWGSDKSYIGGNINSPMFNIDDTKFSLRNLTIKNIFTNSKLISGQSSRIFLDNCVLDNNEMNCLIEAELLGIKNTVFNNNEFTINTKNLSITNLTSSDNNVLFNSTSYGNNWEITDSTFTHNQGSIFLFSANTLTIKNSMLNDNTGKNQDSCIIIEDSAKLNIISTIITNNKVPIINKIDSNSIVDIKNSIILNNSAGFITNNFDNIDCNYNWWGNTIENAKINPINNLVLNWLFLDISYPTEVEHGITYTVKFSLNNLITNENITSKYSNYQLPKITFNLKTENITTNKNSFELETGQSQIAFNLDNLTNGFISANYENVKISGFFNFTKSNPKIDIIANAIFIGQEGIVEVTLPNDATGNVSILISNISQSKTINNSKAIFYLNGLTVKTHNLLINYGGDNKYLSKEENTNFTVNKYESTTKINVGEINLNEDVIITVEVPSDATGNVSLFVNNIEHILNITNSIASYTIKNITRGDWNIKAIYNGDYKYNPSEDAVNLGVAKLNSSVIINLWDISYGEDAEVQIFMDNAATGNVTVIIDDKNKTDKLVNGRATIIISNLTAGYKNVQVKYSGDSNYNGKTYSSVFYIDQIPTSFSIETTNALEGKDVIIELSIPKGVEGNFIINVGDITEKVAIPESGYLSWTTSKLMAGNYTATVTYNGQNYKTCKNTAKVTVYPWKETQWPNSGYDDKNTGKSPYPSGSNNLSWTTETTEQIKGNIAIDSMGNICIITTNGVYSYDKSGKLSWKFSSYNNNFSGIAVGREVVIAPVSGDTLYFINQTYGQKYGYSNIWQGSSVFAPIIDEKCNIYISGEKIYDTGKYNLVIIPYSIWEYGGQVISIDLGSFPLTTAPVIVNENVVCVGTEEGLKLVDISRETVISTLNILTSVRPVVGDSGIIYTLTSSEIIAIDSLGDELWKSNITGGEARYLAIDNENNLIYSINKNGNLYKYDILNSGRETLLSNLTITSGILIGNEGTVYVASNNMFVALDLNGKYLWKSDLGKTITGTPVMDASGNIYVTGNNALFALTEAQLKEADLNVNVENAEYGNDIKIIVNMNKEATGEISVNINGNELYSKVNDGFAEISIPNLAVSNYNVNLTYSGDKRFSANEQLISFNVTKKTSPATDIVIPSEVSANNPTFTIELPSDATGNLTVSVDGKEYSQKLVDGKATVNVPKLSSGNHKITVTYSGDENYASITTTKTVNVPSPKITNNKNIVMDYNDGSVYKVRVIGSDGNIVVGGFVTFKINGKTSKIKTNKNGYASVKIAEIPKKYTITATYKETTVKNTVTVKQILKSSNFKVKKSAKKLVLKATLKSSKGKAIKGKQIKFKFNGKTYKAKTNKNGIAKVTIKKNVIKKLKVKKYALQITYLKDTLKKTVAVKK